MLCDNQYLCTIYSLLKFLLKFLLNLNPTGSRYRLWTQTSTKYEGDRTIGINTKTYTLVTYND